MRKSAPRLLLPVFALAVLVMGCAMPLPPAELTATAESQLPPTPEARRIGGEVQSTSSGAPGNASLALQQSAEEEAPRSVLASIEEDEIAEITVDEAEAVETATPEPTGTPEPKASTPAPEPAADVSAYASEALALLNQYRAEKGLPALQWDATIAASATAYAEYMASSGFFGHYPPTGSTPAGRIAAAGFTGQYAGETISAGQHTPVRAVSNFLASPEHAAILLSANPSLAGVGFHYDPNSYYRSYWVIVTANP